MSDWAVEECRSGNDTEEIRDLITTPFSQFYYYMAVKKRKSFLINC